MDVGDPDPANHANARELARAVLRDIELIYKRTDGARGTISWDERDGARIRKERQSFEREDDIAVAYLDLVDRVLPSLRREHVAQNDPYPECPTPHGCDCGADEHNAIIDAIIGPPT